MAKKPRKKLKWIILAIIVLVICGIGIFAYTQIDNIRALSYMKKYTAEQRQELLKKNNEDIQRILEKIPAPTVIPLDEEQEKMLNSGELTEEDALKIMTGKADNIEEEIPDNIPEETPENNEGKSTAETVEEKPEANNTRLQELVARVYLLRSSFTGRLDGLVSQAKKEYTAQKGKNVGALVQKYVDLGMALESQCDAQMEALLSEIQSEITKVGGDTSVVVDMRSSYENEKSIKKASLLDLY